MRQLVISAAVVAALTLPAAVDGARAQSRDGSTAAELSIRLQILEDELRELRGELEVQRFRTRELQRQLNEVREAQGLEPASPAAPASPGSADDPAFGGDGTRTDQARTERGRTLDGEPGSPSAVLDTPTLEGEPTRRADAPTSGAYDRGLALLQAGQYTDARREFEGFVSANPQDPRAPEAAFWAAETLFVEGEYQQAAAAFAENYRSFGADAPRAPDSLLKVALSLAELGDTSRACRTLEALALRHQDLSRSLETAAERARERAGC